MSSLVIDTNIVIIGSKKNSDILKSLQLLAEVIYISAISIAELFAIAGISTYEERYIKKLLETMQIIPVDYAIAFQAALLARTRPSRQHRSDLIIAATALVTNSKLVTFNERDFIKIPNLELIKL